MRSILHIKLFKKKKNKKGRQGRSAEVRKRKEEEKKKREWSFSENKSYSQCPECNTQDLIEDYTSGDLICRQCGMIIGCGGLAFAFHSPAASFIGSKPYQKVVHFRQRLSQLEAKDPEQDEKVVQSIKEFIINNQNQLGPLSTYGIKTFSLICRKLKIKATVATHWIQLRRRIFCLAEPEVRLNPLFKIRITMRYICIAHCFNYILKKPKEEKKTTSSLKRNNIVNLNYSIIQLIRLEDDENETNFKGLARFFPQLISQNQPAINNQRWKLLIEECQKKYQNFL